MATSNEGGCPNATKKMRRIGSSNIEISFESLAEKPVAASADEVLDEIDLQFLTGHMRPFRQGRFDHFCGVYALMNCFRVAIQKVDPEIADEVDWAKVFAVIINEIYDSDALHQAILRGIDTNQIVDCLVVVAQHLEKRHKIKITFKWPWLFSKPSSRTKVIARLAEFLDENGTGLLIYYVHWGLGHWSVLERISDGFFHLFDSAKSAPMAIHHIKLSGQVRSAHGVQYVLETERILVLTASIG